MKCCTTEIHTVSFFKDPEKDLHDADGGNEELRRCAVVDIGKHEGLPHLRPAGQVGVVLVIELVNHRQELLLAQCTVVVGVRLRKLEITLREQKCTTTP